MGISDCGVGLGLVRPLRLFRLLLLRCRNVGMWRGRVRMGTGLMVRGLRLIEIGVWWYV